VKTKAPWVCVNNVAMPQSRPATTILHEVNPPESALTAASAARVLYQWWVGTIAGAKSKTRKRSPGSRMTGPRRIGWRVG